MKIRPSQMPVVTGLRVRVNVTEEMRKASGDKLAYPTRPGQMTGNTGHHALAEVDFGPDPRSTNGRPVRDYVPREALVLA